MAAPEATAVDTGVPGITVTAYDANNNVAATATTDANGDYSLNPASNGSFRIEFTNLPNGVYFGPSGTTSGSAVQFVSSNSAINVDLGVVRPGDFSPDNPTLVTSEYVVGGSASTDLNNGAPVVVSFPETSGAAESDPTRSDHQDPSKTDLASQSEVGATWGLSYDANTNELYAAAFMKRTTGFGPGGSGAIYQINPTTNATSVYVDLNSIFSDYPGGNFNDLYTDSSGNPVTLRTNTSSPTYWFTDGLEEVTDSTGVVRDVGWDAVGKTGFGGIATSADGSTIYAMALGDRMLYSIPTSGALNTTTIQRFSLPVPGDVTGVTAANPDGDLQPFAVTEYRGIVYIGAVNSAESTQNAADLNAYIFAFNPATGRFIDSTGKPTITQPVFEFNLNYPRGYTQQGGDPDPNYPERLHAARPRRVESLVPGGEDRGSGAEFARPLRLRPAGVHRPQLRFPGESHDRHPRPLRRPDRPQCAALRERSDQLLLLQHDRRGPRSALRSTRRITSMRSKPARPRYSPVGRSKATAASTAWATARSATAKAPAAASSSTSRTSPAILRRLPSASATKTNTSAMAACCRFPARVSLSSHHSIRCGRSAT